MKLRKTRKGFTIVELVIVIAVIGVLAAVLIPTFVNLTDKANQAADDSLVKNLNTALATQEVIPDDPENDNFHEAIIDLDNYGYKLTNLITKSSETLLWNSKTNRFLLEKNIAKESNASRKYEFWKISNTVDESGYSIYAGNDFNESNPVNLTRGQGFDTGFKAVENISYSRAYNSTTDGTDNHTVVIRTNSFDSNLTINAANDVVKHYGKVGSLNIIAVKGESYHEFGEIAFAEIATGRIALEAGSKATQIHLTATTGDFNDITIAKASDVEMPKFSRDPVEIPEEGKLIVALQDGTATETSKEYVWLTNVGIYEQVTVSSSSESAGTNYAATSESVAQDKKDAAAQIANNITATVLGYDYVVKAEKVGNDWVYTLEGESEQAPQFGEGFQVTVSEDSQVSVMHGETPVETTTTVENGLDESQKDSEKAKAINEDKGNIYFTASIEDIGSGYFNNFVYLQPNGTKNVSIDDNTIRTFLGVGDDTLYGVSWTSTNEDVADVTVELISGDDDEEELGSEEEEIGFGFEVEEETDLDEDDEEDGNSVSDGVAYKITINGKSLGRTTITLTYYNLEDESVKVDYTYNVSVAGTQVMIGENVYNTLEAAVAAAQNGDTIKLFQDISSSMLSISTGYLPGVSYNHYLYTHTDDTIETQLTGVKDLKLDLNGYSINTSSLSIDNTSLEIIDTSINKTGTITGSVSLSYFYGDTASLTWNSYYGRYVETSVTYNDPTVVTFTGGTIKQVEMSDYRRVVINGSRIINNDPTRPNFTIYSIGGYSLSFASIEIKSGIVWGTQKDINTNSSCEITITGGAFKSDPSAYVDLEKYNVEPNADYSLWTVYAK